MRLQGSSEDRGLLSKIDLIKAVNPAVVHSLVGEHYYVEVLTPGLDDPPSANKTDVLWHIFSLKSADGKWGLASGGLDWVVSALKRFLATTKIIPVDKDRWCEARWEPDGVPSIVHGVNQAFNLAVQEWLDTNRLGHMQARMFIDRLVSQLGDGDTREQKVENFYNKVAGTNLAELLAGYGIPHWEKKPLLVSPDLNIATAFKPGAWFIRAYRLSEVVMDIKETSGVFLRVLEDSWI